jgi:hypothetical protein
MNPPKSILDPTFVYVPAVDTDIRKLFARVRNEPRMVGCSSLVTKDIYAIRDGPWIVTISGCLVLD